GCSGQFSADRAEKTDADAGARVFLVDLAVVDSVHRTAVRLTQERALVQLVRQLDRGRGIADVVSGVGEVRQKRDAIARLATGHVHTASPRKLNSRVASVTLSTAICPSSHSASSTKPSSSVTRGL